MGNAQNKVAIAGVGYSKWGAICPFPTTSSSAKR